MSDATISPTLSTPLLAQFSRRKLISFAVPLVMLAYLVYAFIAFDVAGWGLRVVLGAGAQEGCRQLVVPFWKDGWG